MPAQIDPIMQALIDAGLVDANGNWLVDPTTGQPTGGGSSSTPEPDIGDIMSRFEAARKDALASGKTEADFKATDQWAGFNSEIRDAISKTTDKTWLQQSRDWQLQNLSDPTYGEHYRELSTLIGTRLETLDNPLSPFLIYNFNSPTLNEGQINADRDAIYKIAQDSYASLLQFQQEQRLFANKVADDLRIARELAIPRAPEQSGRVVAGGSAAGRARTDLGDLLIRL